MLRAKPFVSVIISTKNEEKHIRNCLISVKKQRYPQDKLEIIVVDNFSSDKTREIAGEFTPLVYERGQERSEQRNFGVERCQGEYFIFLDADMTLDPGVIEECVKKISGDGIVALYIPEIITGGSFFSKVRRFERKFYDGTAIDGVRFMRKDKFWEAGGFDERMYACEDWDLTKRIGKIGKTDIIKSALSHNEEEFCLKKYLEKKSYYSKNMNVYVKKWGKTDLDVKKQFGIRYRFFGVFIENGKLRRLIVHPFLAAGMYFLKFLTGINYLKTRLTDG